MAFKKDAMIKKEWNVRTMICSFRLTSKANVDLDPTLGVLFFDSMQERVKPFHRAEVMNDPSKVTYPRYGPLNV